MVHRRFAWPFGAQRASLCGSFTGWRECPMGLVGAEFQLVFDLQPGVYQYRFLVDGVWRCDDTKPIVRDEYGMINNQVLVTLVENNTNPVVQLEPSSNRRTNMHEGTILTTMPPEPPSQNSGVQIAVFRHRVSEILLHNTIYDVVPVSSKIAILDARLPVKQAFNIMHDEGLALVPLWEPWQERSEDLPRVGFGVLVEGGGAPGGRRLLELHGDGGADHPVASEPVFDWTTDCKGTFL